tara:strand:- start:1042 stop:1497 length:456 start_codon:yes stop_codon:yes gene_type:complete
MEKTESLEIKTGRRYLTADGDVAHVLKDDARGSHPVLGYIEGMAHDYYKSWTKEGIFDIHTKSNNSCAIVSEIPEDELVPFDSSDDLKVDGSLWIKATEDELSAHGVRDVRPTGVDGFSWDALFYGGWEYSESFRGPWLAFAKNKQIAPDS